LPRGLRESQVRWKPKEAEKLIARSVVEVRRRSVEVWKLQ